MADKKISQLTAATTPLAGTEVLPIVQGGSTVKVSIDNVTKGRTVNATTFDTDVASAGVTLTGVTLSADGTDANIDINVTPKGTGSVNIAKANIDGGTVDGTTIGGASAAAGTFTTATATRLTASGDYAANGGDLTLTNTNGGRSWRLGDGIGGLVGSLVVFDGTGSAIRSSWDSSGNYKIDNGNLVIGTAGKAFETTGYIGINSSTATTVASGVSFIAVVRDRGNGDTALILYENNTTPVIVSQNAAKFVTGSPGANEIQIADGGSSITAKSGATIGNTNLNISIIKNQ